eukprot:CAMPEP_0178388902 /NCGR_PEP_ID=MMETSP0689_2-20121128/9833_1 /TAXON_ID=160604 /ORGANISM="Amphidinium massartii, Strain CS-259" /LENGTH=61 /DNA_ID=CAMNT_0020009321 /DNA_START=259 /DNA_END=441 /DNA_ORIENTATION=+
MTLHGAIPLTYGEWFGFLWVSMSLASHVPWRVAWSASLKPTCLWHPVRQPSLVAGADLQWQ